MSLINRLEPRFGRWAIPNLTLILIVGQAARYVASILPQGVTFDRILLDPARVLQGQVWRLATFLFLPPAVAPIFAIFYFLLLHLFGTTLERHWGAFRFNVFLLIGYLANVAAAFIAWFAVGESLKLSAEDAGQLVAGASSNGFLYGSLFLAFARLYPDFIMNLFFVLPIRIRWLALLMWITYGYFLATGPLVTKLMVLASVANYLVFFGREHWAELRHGHRRRSYQASAKRAAAPPTHVCRKCGLSSEESPKSLFRYCSQCTGQVCYCPAHIRDHEHVGAESAAQA
jgi:hypothetical protein